MTNYEYSVDLSFGELLKFQLYVLMLRMKLWFMFAIWTIVGLYMVTQIASGKVSFSESRTAFLLVFGFPVLLIGLTVVSTYRVYKRTWRPNLPIQFSVGPEGVSTTMPSMASQIKWSGIEEQKAWGGLLFLFLNRHCALIIPTRCLGERSQEFREYVGDRLRRDV